MLFLALAFALVVLEEDFALALFALAALVLALFALVVFALFFALADFAELACALLEEPQALAVLVVLAMFSYLSFFRLRFGVNLYRNYSMELNRIYYTLWVESVSARRKRTLHLKGAGRWTKGISEIAFCRGLPQRASWEIAPWEIAPWGLRRGDCVVGIASCEKMRLS